ncbi:MAG: hypothetical protein ABF289_19645 [Clostridiales bacterium]
MINLSLEEKEVELLKLSINHCLKTCKSGVSAEDGCKDCESLENVLKKIENIKK